MIFQQYLSLRSVSYGSVILDNYYQYLRIAGQTVEIGQVNRLGELADPWSQYTTHGQYLGRVDILSDMKDIS